MRIRHPGASTTGRGCFFVTRRGRFRRKSSFGDLFGRSCLGRISMIVSVAASGKRVDHCEHAGGDRATRSGRAQRAVDESRWTGLNRIVRTTGMPEEPRLLPSPTNWVVGTPGSKPKGPTRSCFSRSSIAQTLHGERSSTRIPQKARPSRAIIAWRSSSGIGRGFCWR